MTLQHQRAGGSQPNLFQTHSILKGRVFVRKKCPIAEIVSSSDGLRDLSPKSLSSVGDFCEERSQSQSLKKNILAT